MHGVFCNAAWSPQDQLQQPTVVAGGGVHAFLALSYGLPYGHFLNPPPPDNCAAPTSNPFLESVLEQVQEGSCHFSGKIRPLHVSLQ